MPINRISEEMINEIVENYPGLTVLNLSNNEIVEIQNLSPLSSLTCLNLSGNQILVNL
jgi:Leucine-rich repeat (LRR) protein